MSNIDNAIEGEDGGKKISIKFLISHSYAGSLIGIF
jgi:hypothetical protein